MRITEVEIRACSPGAVATGPGGAVDGARLRGGSAPEVVVLSVRTDEGVTGVSFGSGGLDARITARAFAQIRPFLLGRDPMAREQNALEFRSFDRRWNHSPIYAYGPYDVACWDIAGKRAGLPIHELIGTAAERRAVYVSSMFHATPEEYVAEALEVKARGLRGYKVHPPAPAAADLEVYAAVREAVGPDFPLMADPVATHGYEEALRVGRVLESLEAALLRFTAIRGIGPWTAQYIAMRALKLPDALPVGDVGLLRALETGTGRPSPAELLARAEAWRPFRAYAAQHLWAADEAAVTGR